MKVEIIQNKWMCVGCAIRMIRESDSSNGKTSITSKINFIEEMKMFFLLYIFLIF